jgi:hypothetical protein
MDNQDVFADEIFGFHVQQATEKCLKAWIAAIGRVYPLIHDLGVLMKLLEEQGYDCSPFSGLQQYSPFAVRLRYEVVLDSNAPIDRPGAIALVQSLYNTVLNQVESAD